LEDKKAWEVPPAPKEKNPGLLKGGREKSIVGNKRLGMRK
jgi:hypothetical protein